VPLDVWATSLLHYGKVGAVVSFGFDCALHDSAAPQDAQAETTARRIRITNDVPILRIDHISIETMLLGVWQVSYKRECDPDSREMNRWLHFFTRGAI
jgi:hypothetical protein